MMTAYHGPASNPWAFSFVAVMGGMEVRGESATVLSTLEAFDDGTGNTVHLKGQNDDIVAKQNRRWLLEERRWTLMPLEDHAAMAD